MTGVISRALRITACSAVLLSGCRDATREQPPSRQTAGGSDGLADLDCPQYRVWPFDAAEAKRRQAETAVRLGVPVEQTIELADGVGLELVLIPAGRFVMGFEDSDLNKPREVVIARPFYMGKLELTWRQYMVFKQKDHLANLRLDTVLKHERERLDHPIQGIAWRTCRDYCKAASKALGCTMRLPTEAEWEYAAGAGSTKRFIWDDVLRVGDANASRPVQRGGQCRANPWGLYDMIGNVSELVFDQYRAGKDEPVRTVRDDPGGDKGIAARHPELWTSSGPYDGFRVVVEMDQKLLSSLKVRKAMEIRTQGS